MTSKRKQDFEKLLLEAHLKGAEQAIDLSSRTGVPLVTEKNSNHPEIKIQYVRVPIRALRKRCKI